jgi:hypothetical protein
MTRSKFSKNPENPISIKKCDAYACTFGVLGHFGSLMAFARNLLTREESVEEKLEPTSNEATTNALLKKVNEETTSTRGTYIQRAVAVNVYNLLHM